MVRLSLHTAREMGKRRITTALIEAAIALPDRTEADPRDPGLTRSFKHIAAFGNRVLRVVHRPEGNDIFIVTAHWDRGAQP